jgi:glucosyl-dolichyl phosphate glucuronosyltransferase
MGTMRIDVAICTWNRSSLLADTLQQLRQLNVPPGVQWQLLIVDNNSTDATARVIRSFEACLPLRSVFEPEPGHANARNRAVREVDADYMIWTDDDVLVDPEWLAAYVRAFRTWPDGAFFGGPVEPWFEGTPPRWLKEHWRQVANVFAVRELGATPFAFTNLLVPFGANYAVRMREQRTYLYDRTLGRKPDSDMGGEETQVIRQMLAGGATGWWVPDARVRHVIPRARQSLTYVRRFFIGQGEVQGRTKTYDAGPRLFGHPRWLIRRALTTEARYQWSRLVHPPEIWLDRLITAATVWGQVKASS